MLEKLKEKNTVNLEQEKSSNSPKDKIMQKITKEDLLNSGAHFGLLVVKQIQILKIL